METENYPLVTVVTATYNHFDLLFKSIESVLVQDYPRIEYVISDDGSSSFPYDQIVEYVEQHKHSNLCRFLVLTEASNKGTVRNLNKAYKNSSGEYIINLSCGDVFFDADIVSKIIAVFMDSKANVVVTSRLACVGNKPIELLPHYAERSIIEKKYNGPLKQYKALILGMSYDMASGSAMSFSKKTLERMNYYDERFYLFEDGPFLLKYLESSELTFAYDIISIWYQADGVSSASKELRNPLYQKDLDLFNDEDRKAHLEMLSKREKKKLRFCYDIINSEGKRINKAMSVVKYFPESLCYLFYLLRRRINRWRDKMIIEKIG